ncbi:MAG: DUF481 domain-containing protein [Bacteroidetes bacterium]|nr:MAG: DUF481 domain-containing protein [Bacteroidota bacterium]
MKHLLFCSFFVPFCLFAQVNSSDTLRLKAGLSVTGFWQGGNVQTVIFRTATDVSARPWEKVVFKTQNSYVYQAFGGTKADEDILSLNFLEFYPNRRVHPLLLGFVSSSFRRAIRLRSLLGAGVSLQVLNKEAAQLRLSVTTEYEQTDFTQANFNVDAYDGQAYLNTFRGTLWVQGKYQLAEKKVVLTHESYVQPSLQQGDNFRWQATVGASFPIWKYLSFTINYRHTFENIVIEGQHQEDTFLTFGFTIKSYK